MYYIHMVFVWFQCINQKLNPSFLFDLYQGLVANEHQYVTKMYKGQFTFGRKYQYSLCFDVECIFNLSLYI
jgi:hypothetical protein